MSDAKAAFIRQANVSRETLDLLEIYAALLDKWNKKINLVAPGTVNSLWTRHFLDSSQLFQFAPMRGHWVDIGSGGGFPGAIIGILAREQTDLRVTLIESDQRKCAFLRTIARECQVSFDVITARIESAPLQEADVLSARALAPLNTLLEFAARHLSPKGSALFLKGRQAKDEVAEALEHWSFDCEALPSKTDDEAVVLKIGGIERVRSH